jgi:hypothetical protein
MSRFAPPLSAAVLVTATVALAACGGGGSSSGSAASTGTNGTSTTPGAGATRTAALQKFTQCLKDNGVTPPQRRPGPGGKGRGGYGGGFRADPKLQKALQACAKLRPQGAGGFGGRGGRQGRGGAGAQQSIEAFTPYLNCLKDAGLPVKVSDGFNALRNLERDDPKVQTALKSCQPKIPQRPRGAPGGGTAPGSGPGDTTGSRS